MLNFDSSLSTFILNLYYTSFSEPRICFRNSTCSKDTNLVITEWTFSWIILSYFVTTVVVKMLQPICDYPLTTKNVMLNYLVDLNWNNIFSK